MTYFSLETFAREVLASQPKFFSSYRRTLGIQLTSACPLSCAHCIFSCHGEGEDLPLAVVGRLMREWSEMSGVQGVGLTGGEPFFRRELLKFAVDQARSFGLEVRVVTSGYWASSRSAAHAMLKNFPHLTELIVSVDRYHQQAIRPQMVVNLMDAAREMGISASLMVTVGEEGLLPELVPMATFLGNRISPKDIRVARMLTFGRASGRCCEPVPPDTLVACAGLNVPLVSVGGELSLCCVPPATGTHPALLSRGSVFDQSLAQCFTEDELDYWILQALRTLGPTYFAKKQGVLLENQTCTADVCKHCIRLWNDPETYHSARFLTRQPELREDVAWRLHRLGDSTPLSRFYTEAALGLS